MGITELKSSHPGEPSPQCLLIDPLFSIPVASTLVQMLTVVWTVSSSLLTDLTAFDVIFQDFMV